MSIAKELADVEAAIAEAELSEAELSLLDAVALELAGDRAGALEQILAERENEAAAAAAPTPAEPSTEPTEKHWRELERERERHEKAVHKIMGSFVEGFETCEKCQGHGVTPPGPELQAHSDYRACPTCEGFGKVLTGARNEANVTTDCPTCRGRGYQERMDRPALASNGAGERELVSSAPLGLDPFESSPPAPAAAPAGEQWGVPAWMGDTQIGR